MSNRSFFHAFKWSVAGELASRAIQPFVFILLARLLTPDDYGVMAAAVMVLSFSQVFWEAGLGKALVFERDNIDSAANVSFWINLIVGIVIGILLFAASDFLAIALFSDERVSLVLRVMTLQIILGSIASVQNALLQRDLKFNKLFWVRMSTVAAPAILSLPMAIAGWSYWALVAGSIFGQAAQVIVLWILNPWRPKVEFNLLLAKKLVRFGGWVTLSGLLAWFYLWIDSMFVGSYLGTHDLGLYRTGNQFVMMVYGLLFGPLLPVLYSHLSGMRKDEVRIREFYLRILRIVAFISVPMGFFLFVAADDIASVVFNDQWTGVGFVLGIMGIMHGFSHIVVANGEVYRAMGKPAYESAVGIVCMLVYLIGYYFSVREGLEIFVWTRFGLALFAVVLHITFAWFVLKLSIRSFVTVILMATFVGTSSILADFLTQHGNFAPLARVVLVASVSAIIMLPLIYAFEKNGVVKDLLSIIKTRKTI